MARTLGHKFAFGEVDCEMYDRFCKEFGIEGFPSVYMFPPYSNMDTKGTAYEGSRENVPDAVNSLERHYKTMNATPPKIVQLVDPDEFKDECMQSSRRPFPDPVGCAIFFLPQFETEEGQKKHILYIKNLQIVGRDSNLAYG